MTYSEETITFNVNNAHRQAILRSPHRQCARPALLISLASDCGSALDGGCAIVAGIFLAAGHNVVAFDLPSHGKRIDDHGEGLLGWANAARAGIDVFEDTRNTVRTLIDLLMDRKVVDEKLIVLDGTSRGGIIALHLLAADQRVLAASIHAPVTYLPALHEFRGLAGHPIIQHANAESLLPQLADRPLLIAMGTRDERISAECCFGFHAKLRSVSTQVMPTLFVGPGPAHNIAESCFYAESGYHAAAGFLLMQCAQQMKMHGHIG